MPKSTSKRRTRRGHRPSALLWFAGWFVATSALAGIGVVRHAPALERAMGDGVRTAIAPLSEEPLAVTVRDHEAVLSGTVADAERRDAVLAAAERAPGIRRVVDRLDVLAPAAPAPSPQAPADTQAPLEEEEVPSGVPPAPSDMPLPDEESPLEVPLAPDSPTPDSPTPDLPMPDEPPSEPALADTPSADGSPSATDDADLPSLQLDVTGKVLTLDGTLSTSDDPAPLVRAAMNSFDLDYVSNGIEAADDIATADWLEPIASLMPTLTRLADPGLHLSERRVTLRGTAPDGAVRDEVVATALERLDDYSIIMKITVAEAGTAPGTPDEATPEAAADSEVDDGAIDVGTTDDSPPDDRGGEAADARPEPQPEPQPEPRPVQTARLESPEVTPPSAEEGPAAAMRAEMNALSSLKILFRSGSDTLTDESADILDAIAEVLLRHPDIPVAIEGHTDALGDRGANLRLSQLRASAVRDYMAERGVSRRRLSAYGYGEGLPIADNSTPEGRAANRRIEFTY